MVKNLEEEVEMKNGKIENFYKILGYKYYDQVNKNQLVYCDRKIS